MDKSTSDDCDATCSVSGKCNPDHPIHCCHFVVRMTRRSMKQGYVMSGYGCLKCTKESKSWVLQKMYRGTSI